MRKYLILLVIFLGCFSSSFASFNFDCYWSGDDEDLHFNIDLHPNLVFDEVYGIFSTDDNGLGCELNCKPLEGAEVLSSEGYILQEMAVYVIVKNDDLANEVQYEVYSICTYKGRNKRGNSITVTDKDTRRGRFDNPPVDLTQDPSFFWIDDQMSQGIVQFKNT